MDKILYYTLLIDFYGELLTEKQKETFEAYFFDDLSLGEIGANNNVSRQSVNDLLRRTEQILFDYEKKLKLIEKHSAEKEKLESVVKHIDGLIANGNTGLSELRKMVEDIIDTIFD